MTKKFDVVIGNPPYQEEAQGGGTRDTPLYHLFMDAAYDVGEKAVLITPARFLFNAGFTPKAWKVQTTTSLAARPIKPLARSRISAAALLVNVMAAIFCGGMPASMSRPILCVMTRVLPEPAPAKTKQGPCK
mgnify:CR=1 FL=1